MGPAVHFRWLGVAGIELAIGDQILAIDPFFTRPPLRQFWFGRPTSIESLALEKLPLCNTILVTHPHYDHLLDVPGLAAHTGAQVYGSANACRLCLAAGLPSWQVHQVAAGDQLALEAFSIQVMPQCHTRLPIDWLINGKLSGRLTFPLRLRDYRMDVDFSFQIEVAGSRLLVGDRPVPADVLITIPNRPWVELRDLMLAVKPPLLILIHWDDFFTPLSGPVRPGWQLDWRSFPPIKRLSLKTFADKVERVSPGTKVLVPQIFTPYDLKTLLIEKDPLEK